MEIFGKSPAVSLGESHNFIGNGSQAADDEYYYVSTVKSNGTGKEDEAASSQYILAQNGSPATNVKHIPVTVL